MVRVTEVRKYMPGLKCLDTDVLRLYQCSISSAVP